LRDELRIHLTITIQLHDDLCPIRERSAIAGEHASTDTLINIMEENYDARVTTLLFYKSTRLLRALVVYNVYARNNRTYATNDREDMVPYLVTGDDYRDSHRFYLVGPTI
jgi:hypothetical protein